MISKGIKSSAVSAELLIPLQIISTISKLLSVYIYIMHGKSVCLSRYWLAAMVLSIFFFFFSFDVVFSLPVCRKSYSTPPGMGSDIGVGISKMLKLKIYMMGSVLSGKLSCVVTGLVLISVLTG